MTLFGTSRHSVFDEKKCTAGIEALGFYHERKDEQRSVGLGPSDDWSSHAADAFGLMALSYEDPQRVANFRKPVFPKQRLSDDRKRLVTIADFDRFMNSPVS